MKVKRILTGLLLIVLSMMLLAVSVNAYSFFVGSNVVNAELYVASSTAPSAEAVITSGTRMTLNITLTGQFLMNDGTIQGAGNGGGVQLGTIANTSIPRGANSVRWTEVKGVYSANDGVQSGGTTITKPFFN